MNRNFREQTTELVVAPPFKGKGLVNDRLRFDVAGLAANTDYVLNFNKDTGVTWQNASGEVFNYPVNWEPAAIIDNITNVQYWTYNPTHSDVAFAPSTSEIAYASDPLDGGSFQAYETNVSGFNFVSITGVSVYPSNDNFGVSGLAIDTNDDSEYLVGLKGESMTAVAYIATQDLSDYDSDGITNIAVVDTYADIYRKSTISGDSLFQIVTYTEDEATQVGLLRVDGGDITQLYPLETLGELDPAYYTVFAYGGDTIIITYHVAVQAKYWVLYDGGLSSPYTITNTLENTFSGDFGVTETTLWYASDADSAIVKVSDWLTEGTPTITQISLSPQVDLESGLYSDPDQSVLIGYGAYNGIFQILFFNPTTLAVTNSVQVPEPLTNNVFRLFPKYEDWVLVTDANANLYMLEVTSALPSDYNPISVAHISQLVTAVGAELPTLYTQDGILLAEENRVVNFKNNATLSFQNPNETNYFYLSPASNSHIIEIAFTGPTEASGNIVSELSSIISNERVTLEISSNGEGYVGNSEDPEYLINWEASLKIDPFTFSANNYQTYFANETEEQLYFRFENNNIDYAIQTRKLIDTSNAENTVESTSIQTQNNGLRLDCNVSDTAYTQGDNYINGYLVLGGNVNYAEWVASDPSGDDNVGIYLDPLGVDYGGELAIILGADLVVSNGLFATSAATPTGFDDTTGITGTIAWDDSFIYVKTSAGWAKAALTLLDPTP